MKLVESYLFEVSRHLPIGQHDDILSELRSSIEEQVLDLAGGDTPSADQQKAVLNQFGHPLKVASAYQDQQYLIGPALYPAYIQTLKTVLSALLVALIATQAVIWVTVNAPGSMRALSHLLFNALVWTTVSVTGVFAMLEYTGERFNWYENWQADSLSLRQAATINRSDLVTNIITEGVFLLWWNDVIVLQNIIPQWGSTFSVSLGAIWTPLFLPVNVLVGAWFVLHSAVLIKGVWSRPALLAEIASGILGFCIVAWLLVSAGLITTTGDLGPQGAVIIERSLRMGLLVVGGLIGWDIFLALRRLRQSGISS